MNHRTLLASLVTTVALIHAAPVAAQNCLQPIEARANRVLFDARFELERNRSLTDAFASFNALQRRWNRATWGTAAQSCLRTHPELLLAHQRLVNRGRPLLAGILRRRDQLCESIGPVWLARLTNNIDAALAHGNVLFARAQSDKLARLLTSGRFFRNCPTLRQRVARLRSDYLPRVRAQMRIPGIAKKLAQQRDELHPLFAAAYLRGEHQLHALDSLLSTPRQRTEMRARLAECEKTARLLRRIGANDTTAVGGTQLAHVERECDELAAELPHLVTAEDAHQRAVAARRLRRWERLSIYGSRMWRVYKQRGKPKRQRYDRRGVTWIYELNAGRCLQLRFSKTGHSLGHDTFRCGHLAAR